MLVRLPVHFDALHTAIGLHVDFQFLAWLKRVCKRIIHSDSLDSFIVTPALPVWTKK